MIYLFAGFCANLSDISRLAYVPLFLLVSFALYYARFWRAGDGKLFFATGVFMLPLLADVLERVFLDLVLAVSLCYVSLFLSLFFRALRGGRLREAFAGANNWAMRLDAAAKAAASAVFLVSAGSFLPSGFMLPASLIFAYAASARFPLVLYAAMLLAIPLALLGQHAAVDYVIAFVFLSFLLYFFDLYRSVRQVLGCDEVLPFAPFLFLSTFIVVLI